MQSNTVLFGVRFPRLFFCMLRCLKLCFSSRNLDACECFSLFYTFILILWLLLFVLLSHCRFQYIILMQTCDLYLFCLQFSFPAHFRGKGRENGDCRKWQCGLESLSGIMKSQSTIPKPQQLGKPDFAFLPWSRNMKL